jgi:hypothetical protein
MTRSFIGSGPGQILTSSPWGLGVLGMSGGILTSVATAPNGAVLGQWRLDTSINHVGPTGCFDGSSAASILIHSGWGMGILKVQASGFTSTAMAGNGTPVQGTGIAGEASATAAFNIDTSAMVWGPVGDFDGDGHDAVLVTGKLGIAALKQSGSVVVAGAVAAYPTQLIPSQIGDWTPSAADWFGPVGDYDGDGKQEVLVIGTWGIVLLRFSSVGSGTLVRIANGAAMGGWTLNVATDRFGPAADYDGDGRAELPVFNESGFALLKLVGGKLVTLAQSAGGDWIGSGRLGGNNRVGPAADFDGIGRPQLLVTSPWGFGVLTWNAGAWTTSAITASGTACGAWRTNLAGDRMCVADDFDGDGRAELLVSSGWGMGLLNLSGTPTSKITAANGTALGSWRLDTTRNDLEIGSARTWAIFLYHGDWQSAVNDTQAVLTSRGTTVLACSDTAAFIAALQGFAATTTPGDRLFVYLAVHGNSSRQPGDESRTPCGNHGMEAASGYITLDSISPLFRGIANRGCDLIVFDGSCEGGETVVNAFGERYCAMSTTGVFDPGITGTPDPGAAAGTETKPSTFGVWWHGPHLSGSRLSGRIALDCSQPPFPRIWQRLFRNDTTACTTASIFARGGLDAQSWLNFWWVSVSGCYLYSMLWPAQAGSGTFSASVPALLANAAAQAGPMQPALDAYQASVLDAAYSADCAALYTANYVPIWQCMADDLSWDVAGNSSKYAAQMGGLDVGRLAPPSGCTMLLNQAYYYFLMIQACYQKATVLFTALDAAVRASSTLGSKAPPQSNAISMKIDRNSQGAPLSALAQRRAPTKQLLTDMRPLDQGPPVIIQPPIVQKPTAAGVQAILNGILAQWTASSLSQGGIVNGLPLPQPTGDATVDGLAAQLFGTYLEQMQAEIVGSFLLTVAEDLVCATQSSGQMVPGDIVTF